MPYPQENQTPYPHPLNSHDAGAWNQQDSGQFGPSTFQGAGAHVYLHPHEVDRLSRASQPATSSTVQLQTQGSSNPQTYSHRHGQSQQGQQYPPHMVHQMTHNQANYPVAYQHPTSGQVQGFHSPQPQPQPQPWTQHPQRAPQAAPTPAPAPAPGGSRPPHPSVDYDSAWDTLSSDRMRWNPNSPEPLRPDGQSILMNFTSRQGNTIYCRVPTQSGYCNYPNVKKERLLHHMRKDHLNFFPFVCGGSCRSRSCTQRFASEKARSEHIAPRKIDCPNCGKKLYSQNYASHHAKCSQR